MKKTTFELLHDVAMENEDITIVGAKLYQLRLKLQGIQFLSEMFSELMLFNRDNTNALTESELLEIKENMMQASDIYEIINSLILEAVDEIKS